ncbi:MAG: hypothetical protein Q8N39_11835 [Pelolinea sp.]|nr:hypothetical protein [Pelolinea sp.]
MKKQINKFLLFLWSVFSILGSIAFREFYNLNILTYVGSQNIWESKRFLAFIIVSFFFIFGALYGLLRIVQKRRFAAIEFLKKSPVWPKSLAALLLILMPGLVKWILPLPENFTIGFWMEFFIIFTIAILIKYLLIEDKSSWKSLLRIGCYTLLAGASHVIFYKLSQVTSYPFTLYWSEGNRFFDYSTLFGSFRYILADGERIKAFTTWGMQLPWALPFVIPGLSIGFFRLWYQIIWILPTFVLGLVAAHQIKAGRSSLFLTLIFASWTFLFLDQGPIYTPLVIGAILTVIAARAKLLPGILIILVASYYTRNARWTWSYAPGLWAGLLALLAIEKPSFSKQGLKELVKPAALGITGYLGGQLIPSLIKSINSSTDLALLPNAAASTSRQPLLWDRLFPNPTYPPGILWALIWAALPVVLLLAILILQKKWQTNWLQNLALLIIPGAFLIVGIVASVKIGGGSNLHNLDMFLMSLALIASSAWVFILQKNENTWKLSSIASIFLFIVLVSPVTFTLIGGERLTLPDNEIISKALAAVQNKVEKYSQQGEILFIDHRQLFTFNLVKKVPLVDDYEKKYLMDQAMANNEKYFNTFYKDLAERRFVLIVNEPSNLVVRGSEYSFGEENDAYVKWVTVPLLCTYEPLYTSPKTSVELLVPRETPPPTSLNCDSVFAAVK